MYAFFIQVNLYEEDLRLNCIMHAFLLQVNLYEEDLRLNCNVRFPYPDESI